MGLTRYKLGELIEVRETRNNDLELGVDDVRGISIQKVFIPTKANMKGVSLGPYFKVLPSDFAYVTVTSRNGQKITLAHNSGRDTYIVSSSYVVFHVALTDVLDPDYLFMYFNRPEFDRYARFNSWGSARETFSWNEMREIDLDLPALEVQRKYVAIYNAMVANQKAYEQGLEDLQLAEEALLDTFKNDVKRKPLGELISEVDIRNINSKHSGVQGVKKEKIFMPSVSVGADLSKYKLISKDQFACNLMHVGRDVAVPIAMNTEEEPLVVSPAYFTFEVTSQELLPDFLLAWMSRGETDRYAWFICDTSIRSGMEKSRFNEICVPVPDLELQRSLIEISRALIDRRAINDRLKAQIKAICPVLIKGSLEEGARHD
ncbi:type I restriction endonuclease subunit S [Actinotignum sanguinis]|uniref:restriction endonuclease subunit S n=1 Tax=Actinotignum sanguinis TaxID=1445614 RepID=UPI000F7DD0C8|nr:restriction endonuclease subunit S [Actinotignum sanguinis]MDY5148002.1 restriction endonuclease subunit S [Actinotignum sanguinis]RTE50038.1 type I restriction endonuclease subunit S [Actinotignum sanguinis]